MTGCSLLVKHLKLVKKRLQNDVELNEKNEDEKYFVRLFIESVSKLAEGSHSTPNIVSTLYETLCSD